MKSRVLQALGMACLLGTAVYAVEPSVFVSAAQAATVRPQVGKPLQAAVALANAGKGAAAMEKVHEAESVGGLTGSEQSAISQTRNYVAAKTGSGGSAVGCKAKFANDYNQGRYRDVIGGDAECLRKAGGFDFSSQVIVAQAYYLMGDYPTAIRLLRGLGSSEQVLSLLMSAAAKSGDTQTEGDVAERLILQGQSKYWTYMLAAADATRGLTDHENLAIYRVRYATGNMRNAEDYELMTQLAIELHFPTEAVTVAQKGFAIKTLQGERDTRLLNLAQTQAAKDVAGLPALQKQANASKNGDLLVQYGEDLWGMGKFDDAVNAVQAGVKKGPTHADEAQISLGIVSLGAGQKGPAMAAFAAAKGDAAAKVVGHLWTVYAKAGGGAVYGGTQPGNNAAPASGTGKKRHH